MANMPHPDRQAVTWRLHRDLVAAVKASAAENGETVLALVNRALRTEVEPQPSNVTHALGQLRYLTECRCEESFTARGRHDPACESMYRSDVEELAAALMPRPPR